jgi:omega-hydroxy-beta-dihydromenaquinone-9 sulfotransferase
MGKIYSMKSKNEIIFIIGNSRSGTTMLSRILNNHEQITSFNELHFFNDIVKKPLLDKITLTSAIDIANKLQNRIDNDVWSKINNSEYTSLSKKVIGDIDEDMLNSFTVFDAVMNYQRKINKTRYVLEQTPKNILYYEEIIKVYPNAKFVHIIRDPRAVLASQKNRWKKYQRKADNVPLYNILRTFINYHPFTTLKVWKLVFKKGVTLRNFKNNYYEIKFENLILNHEVELTKLLKYLELDYQSNLNNVPQVGSSNLNHKKNKFGLNSAVINSWILILSKAEKYISARYVNSEVKILGYQDLKSKFDAFVFLYIAIYPIHILGVIIINPKILYRFFKKII